jgi:hypothetical protein
VPSCRLQRRPGELQAVAVGAATPDGNCLCRHARLGSHWIGLPPPGIRLPQGYELLSCPAPATQETGPISGLLGTFMNTIIGSSHPRRVEW